MTKTPQKKYAVDEQTGERFKLEKEGLDDHVAAVISIVYLLAMLAFFIWQLIDIGLGNKKLAGWLGFSVDMNNPSYALPTYAFIAGALGGIVSGLRSFLHWHSELRSFGASFIWKHLAQPWLGAVLAIFTYALVQSGISLLNGSTAQSGNTFQVLIVFSIGLLSGYGSHKVFVWLDAQVNSLFQVSKQVVVPDLTGKSQKDAEEALTQAGLELGKTVGGATGAGDIIVASQSVSAGAFVESGSLVGITLGVHVPNLTNKSKLEAQELLIKTGLLLGDTYEVPQTDNFKIDKVVSQLPTPDAAVIIGERVNVILGKAA